MFNRPKVQLLAGNLRTVRGLTWVAPPESNTRDVIHQFANDIAGLPLEPASSTPTLLKASFAPT